MCGRGLQHLCCMPAGSVGCQRDPSIRAKPAEPGLGEAPQTRIVTDARRSAVRPAQKQAMQRGAAAGFQIGLMPHRMTMEGLRCTRKRPTPAVETGEASRTECQCAHPPAPDQTTGTLVRPFEVQQLKKMMMLLEALWPILDAVIRAIMFQKKRQLAHPVLTSLLLLTVYVGVQICHEGDLRDGLRSAFWDTPEDRDQRHRRLGEAIMQSELHQIANANRLIDQQLGTILSRAGASRVRLDVIHNGVTGVTGMGLLRYDVTNSVAAPGRAPGQPLQNQPLSDWSDVLPMLLADHCIYSVVADLRSSSLKARFESFGAFSVLICPSADVQGRAVGAVLIFWDAGDAVPQGDEMQSLMEFARHVGREIATVLDLRGWRNPDPAALPASQ